MINGTNKKTTIWIILILLVVIGGYTFFSAPKTDTPTVVEVADGEYDTFAQCIYDSGLRVYGSATCSFCTKQKDMFEGSAAYLKEIECDPRNPGSQTELCIQKNISHTPTWVHEDEEGNEVFRFQAGVLSLETLSERSGCPIIKDTEITNE